MLFSIDTDPWLWSAELWRDVQTIHHNKFDVRLFMLSINFICIVRNIKKLKRQKTNVLLTVLNHTNIHDCYTQ